MIKNVKHKRVNIIFKEEPQTIVKLEDGTIIKIQVIVFGVMALYNDDGSRKFNEDGSPLYGVNQQNMLYVDTFETIPEGTKRN